MAQRVARLCACVLLLAICTLVFPHLAFSGSTSELVSGFSSHDVKGARLLFRRDAAATQGVIGALMMTGTGDQLPGETHCAHIAEHMVLKYPVVWTRSIWNMLFDPSKPQDAGYIGGFTDLDSTQFTLVGPNVEIPSLLSSLLNALFRLDLAQDSYYTQEIRSHLVPELQTMTRQPVSASINRMRRNLLSGSAYFEDFWSASVTSVKASSVREFMRREYSPNRLTVIVIADCDETAIVETFARALEGVEPGAPQARRLTVLSPIVRDTMTLPDISKKQVVVGLAVDGVDDGDQDGLSLALNALANRLLQGTASGLTIAPELCYQYSPQGARALVVGFTLDEPLASQPPEAAQDAALAYVREVVDGLSADPITSAETSSPPASTPLDPSTLSALQRLPATYGEVSAIMRTLLQPQAGFTSGQASGHAAPIETLKAQSAAARLFPLAKISALSLIPKPSIPWTLILTLVTALGMLFLPRKTRLAKRRAGRRSTR